MLDRLPRYVDVLRAAFEGVIYEGRVDASCLPRLGESIEHLLEPASGRLVLDRDWESKPRLRLTGRADVQVRCERCLGPLQLPLSVDVEFILVRSEAQGQRITEEGGDFLVAVPNEPTDVHAVLEDELILALAPIPKHEDAACIAALGDSAVAAVTDEAQSPAPPEANPFTALKALKDAPDRDEPGEPTDD